MMSIAVTAYIVELIEEILIVIVVVGKERMEYMAAIMLNCVKTSGIQIHAILSLIIF